jgi:hypothetical protein
MQHSNRLRLEVGLSNRYLFHDKWNANKYCAYWEDGINDWWYEQEYIDWRRKNQDEERKKRQILETSPDWIEKETIFTVRNQIDSLTKEKASNERKNWNEMVRKIKDNPNKNVKHKCGATVLPDNISSSLDVCHFCDFNHQPFIANPIFRPYFEKLIPEMVFILFD